MSAVRQFNATGGWVMSSHVALSMLMALFPFLLFVVALAGALTQDVQTEALIELVIGAWPEEIAAPITSEIRAVLAGGNSGLLTVGAVLAFYFASNGVDAIGLAMTAAYHDEDPRPFWRRRLVNFAFVLSWAVLLVATATVGLALPLFLRFFADMAPDLYAALSDSEGILRLSALLVLVVAVTACHLWLPGGGRRPVWRLWPGVALTVVAWIAVGWGFAFYLDRFASYSATYAGLAGVMSALIFLYLMSAILILGAEFNAALERGESGA